MFFQCHVQDLAKISYIFSIFSHIPPFPVIARTQSLNTHLNVTTSTKFPGGTRNIRKGVTITVTIYLTGMKTHGRKLSNLFYPMPVCVCCGKRLCVSGGWNLIYQSVMDSTFQAEKNRVLCLICKVSKQLLRLWGCSRCLSCLSNAGHLTIFYCKKKKEEKNSRLSWVVLKNTAVLQLYRCCLLQ